MEMIFIVEPSSVNILLKALPSILAIICNGGS